MICSLHVIPADWAFEHEVDNEGSCPCGPTPRWAFDRYPYYQHWALIGGQPSTPESEATRKAIAC